MIDHLDADNHRHAHTKHLLEAIIGTDNIILSAITKMELLIGAKDKYNLAKVNKNIHIFEITLITGEITKSAIQLLQDYKLSHGLALPDAFIAATAQISGWELFTYNVKDYKFIKGLTLFDLQLS